MYYHRWAFFSIFFSFPNYILVYFLRVVLKAPVKIFLWTPYVKKRENHFKYYYSVYIASRTRDFTIKKTVHNSVHN